MLLSIISAMNHLNIIGLNNKLPWHLRGDLQRFKHITWGKPVIMGRKTFESIGKALPGRHNIIVTRQRDYQAIACDVASNLEEAISKAGESEEVFIIGGAELYRHALPCIQRMYLTILYYDFRGDCYFPEWNASEWQVIEKQDFSASKENPYPYSFLTLERI